MSDELVYVWVEKRPGTRTLKKLPKDSKNPEIEEVDFVCKSCEEKNNYWVVKGESLRCRACKGTGDSGWKPGVRRSIYNKEIPSWRLNMDDATPEQVLSLPSSEFGKMPRMSKEKWKEYYNRPYEKEKMRKFNEKRRRDNEQLLRSL